MRPVAAPGEAAGEMMRLAASVQAGSEHPLARAFAEHAAAAGLEIAAATDFRSHTGMGVSARVEGREVLVGSRRLMASLEVDVEPLEPALAGLEDRTTVLVAANGRVLGAAALADPVRATSPPAVEALRARGVEAQMLSGDSERAASAAAAAIGVERFIAPVLPADKSAEVERLRARGRVVAMVGDGINDAPALAAADVGIAMGTGTDVAMESAGITLVKGDLRGILRARRLSRATMRNIRQNLFFAFIYNSLGVPVAAGALYPFFGLLLSPMIAAAAMSFSSVSVIGNALRLRKARI